MGSLDMHMIMLTTDLISLSDYSICFSWALVLRKRQFVLRRYSGSMLYCWKVKRDFKHPGAKVKQLFSSLIYFSYYLNILASSQSRVITNLLDLSSVQSTFTCRFKLSKSLSYILVINKENSFFMLRPSSSILQGIMSFLPSEILSSLFLAIWKR